MPDSRMKNTDLLGMKRRSYWRDTCLAKGYLCVTLVLVFMESCSMVTCDADVRQKVLQYAYQYSLMDTEYHWGGQDPLPRTVQLDCSGFVIRCYQYATADYGKYLPFCDATVGDLLTKWTLPILNPAPGDLIFMGNEDSSIPTHVALYDHAEGGEIYFFDCTITETADGVSMRNYGSDNPKIKSFGRMFMY